MLFLLFQIGADRYALEANRVVEVLPLVSLRKVPHAPKGVAGLFNYRGRPVPAIDLCELALNKPANLRLSTRIIIVNSADGAKTSHLLGLIAEQATGMLRKEPADFADPGLRLGTAPFLGPTIVDGQNVIQCLQVQRLLPENVRDLLFAEIDKLDHESR
jgi:chemotaxis-related protein WspB